MTIKKDRLIYSVAIALIMILSIIGILLNVTQYNLVLVVTTILLFVIINVIIYTVHNYLNPLIWFSLMYMTGCLSTYYLAVTDFSTNVFISYTGKWMGFEIDFLKAILFYALGYLMVLVGYISVTNNKTNSSKRKILLSNFTIKDWVLNVVVFFYSVLGIGNFIYNVYSVSGGSLTQYFGTLSLRKYQFEEGGTDVFYNLLYVAVYLKLYKNTKHGRFFDITTILYIALCCVVRFSTGRIIQSLIFVGIIFLLYYQFKRKSGEQIKKIYIILLSILAVIGVTLIYFFRMYTNAVYIGSASSGFLNFFSNISAEFGYYLFDKGNTANIGLLTKIVHSWQDDFGFFYGRTIFNALTSVLPNMQDIFPSISQIIKDGWFGSYNSGALPPTIVGECYANFGSIGVVIIMYLLGMAMGKLFHWIQNKDSYWANLIYIIILLEFFFLIPKNDFSNFPVWSLIFLGISICLMRILNKFKIS